MALGKDRQHLVQLGNLRMENHQVTRLISVLRALFEKATLEFLQHMLLFGVVQSADSSAATFAVFSIGQCGSSI